MASSLFDTLRGGALKLLRSARLPFTASKDSISKHFYPRHFTQKKRFMDFNIDDIDTFTTHSDQLMGGTSVCSVRKFDNFMRFAGTINTELTPASKERGFELTGFCQLRSHEFFPLIHPSENAFKMKIRSDDKLYVFQVYEDMGDMTMFQGVIPATEKPGEWVEVTIPFNEFFQCYQGAAYIPLVRMSPRIKMRQFGFLMADRVGGPFQLDVEYVGFTDVAESRYDPRLFFHHNGPRDR